MTAPTHSSPILEFTSGSPDLFNSYDHSAGWSFNTNEAMVVNALDVFDPTGAGQVRLYDGNGTVLASATVTTTDPVEGTPIQFYTQAITPVSLAANTTYYIAQDFAAGTTKVLDLAVGVTTDFSITYVKTVTSIGLGLNPTSDNQYGGAYNPAFFGPNFDIAVPEPASLTIFGIGAAVLGLTRRRRA